MASFRGIDPSRVRVTFARCLLKGERKDVSPVSNCSLGELQSSTAASDVFALALPLRVRGKNQACSFSGLGEPQVWAP